MHTDDETELDAELVEVLRRAAGGLPGYPGKAPAVVRRRVVRRRRRLAIAVAAGLTATVVLGGVVLHALGGGAAPPEFAANPPATPRLFFFAGGWSEEAGGRQVGLRSSYDFGEVLADGRLVAHKIPGLPTVRQALTLPDGGFVAMGDRTPVEPTSVHPATPTAAPSSTSSAETVAVVRPDGSVRYLVDTAASELLGADDQRVYLWGAGIVALDLATGHQQSLDWPDLHADAVLANGRFAELTGSSPYDDPGPPCTLWLLDAQTGARTSQRTLPANDCWRDEMALSPDGRWLAIAQPGPFLGGNFDQLRLILLNVETGEQTEQLVDEGHAQGPNNVMLQGMAWLDGTSLRLAWTHMPDLVDRIYDVSEVLRTKTVSVPEQ